jgi:hypothetical protein
MKIPRIKIVKTELLTKEQGAVRDAKPIARP